MKPRFVPVLLLLCALAPWTLAGPHQAPLRIVAQEVFYDDPGDRGFLEESGDWAVRLTLRNESEKPITAFRLVGLVAGSVGCSAHWTFKVDEFRNAELKASRDYPFGGAIAPGAEIELVAPLNSSITGEKFGVAQIRVDAVIFDDASYAGRDMAVSELVQSRLEAAVELQGELNQLRTRPGVDGASVEHMQRELDYIRRHLPAGIPADVRSEVE